MSPSSADRLRKLTTSKPAPVEVVSLLANDSASDRGDVIDEGPAVGEGGMTEAHTVKPRCGQITLPH